ncbi:MAG TPA: DUF4296 domain-containing protein [Saprospiraceae bacterium]|nr:DUF4296 domain-containing protein [Saprospiraceae bacterium]HMP23194.1 DUF4296 domain-containing protein [Saprospiraceae bacterium]
MRLVLMLTIFIMMAACGSKQVALPLNEAKMVDMLVDVHFIEAAMQEMPGSLRDSIGTIFYEQFFTIHNVSAADFNQSLTMLRQDPARMAQLYAKVLATLEEREKEVD